MNRQLNIALKTAIVQSGRKQQRVADLAHIDRTKLSHIVAGRRMASDHERQALARVLGRPASVLFEDDAAVETEQHP